MKSLMLAAQNLPDPRFHFTGKLEAPRVCAGFVDDWPEFDAVPATLISMGSWNLGEGIGTCDLIDPARPHLKGYLVNMPTRGVVGAFWSGREHCWRHAPDDYAAIHFHDDDLDDCRWEPSFEFTIPDDLPSGSYAFHLQSTVGEDWVPFYVLPPTQRTPTRVGITAVWPRRSEPQPGAARPILQADILFTVARRTTLMSMGAGSVCRHASGRC
jgi:N,N-dimethylformamidase